MGTNYYWVEEKQPACVHCGREAVEERMHIGKSSAGWCFSLHVTDEIKSLEDWMLVWKRPGHIENEYNEKLTVEEILDRITNRGVPPGTWKDSSDLSRNSAIPGPNNLARHAIGWHVVGHGPGTWDLCEGYFS